MPPPTSFSERHLPYAIGVHSDGLKFSVNHCCLYSAKEMGSCPETLRNVLLYDTQGSGYTVGLADACLAAEWSFWGHVSRV